MLALAAAGLASGCRDAKKDAAAPGAGAWFAKCASALVDLDGLAPDARPAHLIAACAPCDVATLAATRFDGPHAADWLDKLDKAITGCGGYCAPTTRRELLAHLKHQLDTGEHSARPWRKLGELCPDALGVRPDTRGFVGATWFALHRIAAGLGAYAAGPARPELLARATFPLPALPPEGFGLDLPPAPAGAATVLAGRVGVTLLADKEHVARLPWATFAAGRIEVDGFYPGDELTDYAALAADLSDDAPATILAPRQLPAARLVSVLARLGKAARLAVAIPPPLPDYAPTVTLPIALTATPAPGATAIRLAGPDTALPTGPVVLVVDDTVTIETLAAVLARASGQAIALAMAEPPGAAPRSP